jgi:hypothetical protein
MLTGVDCLANKDATAKYTGSVILGAKLTVYDGIEYGSRAASITVVHNDSRRSGRHRNTVYVTLAFESFGANS